MKGRPVQVFVAFFRETHSVYPEFLDDDPDYDPEIEDTPSPSGMN